MEKVAPEPCEAAPQGYPPDLGLRLGLRSWGGRGVGWRPWDWTRLHRRSGASHTALWLFLPLLPSLVPLGRTPVFIKWARLRD